MSLASKLKMKGFKLDLPDTEYHSGPGLSSSNIKQIMRSPSHYVNAVPYDSPTLSFGRMAHTAVMEPHLMDQYKVLGECCATKGSGAACTNSASAITLDGDQVCGIHGRGKDLVEGVTFAKQEDIDACNAMHDAVWDHCSTLLPPLEEAVCEASGFYWTDDVLLKIRPDLLWQNDDGSLIVGDLKSCQDARPVPFQRSATKYGYGISAAFYTIVLEAIGFEVDKFVWIAAEKTQPYGVSVYEASDITLVDGAERCRAAIDDWKIIKDVEPEVMGVYHPEIIPLEIIDQW